MDKPLRFFSAKTLTSVLAVVLLASLSATNVSLASQPPVLNLSGNDSSVLLVVSSADPNAQISLHYPSGSSNVSANIGSTNSAGYFSTTITAGTYNISNYAPVYVSVDGLVSPNQAWPATSALSGSNGNGTSGLYLSPTSISLSSGQVGTVTVTNSTGNLSIPGNTNPSVASFSFSGNILNVNAASTGTTVLTVCDSGTGNCGTLNVSVQTSPLVLSSSNITVAQGQTQTVSIITTNNSVTQSNSISGNTNTSVVSTSLTGNTISVTGLSQGSATITVCSGTNSNSQQCGSLYVTVTSTGTGVSANPNAPLSLAQFSVSSGNQTDNYLSGGNSIVVSFSANQYVTNPLLRVAGTSVTLTGSGNGPYTGTYALTGNESRPIPIVIGFSNTAGASVLSYFWTSNSVAAAPTTPSVSAAYNTSANTTTAINCPAGYTCAANSGSTSLVSNTTSYAFNRYLYEGMTAQGVSDPDVKALQARLSTDGYFSGPQTGYFGPATKAAVQAYQRAYGLSPLGVVGPGTRALLNQGK